MTDSVEDIREALDASARRTWGEAARRCAAVVAVFFCDAAAGVAATAILMWTWGAEPLTGGRPSPDAAPLVVVVCCLQPLALAAFGGYAPGRRRVGLVRLGSAVFLTLFVAWLQSHIAPTRTWGDKIAFFYAALFTTALAYSGRGCLDAVVRRCYRSGLFQRRALFVGTAEEVDSVRRILTARTMSDLVCVGYVILPVDNTHGSPSQTAPCEHGDVWRAAGPLDATRAVERWLHERRAAGLLLGSSIPISVASELIKRSFVCGAWASLLPAGLENSLACMISVRESGAGTLLQLAPLKLTVPQLALKRFLDIVLAVTLLFLIAPVMAVICVAIKLDSRGPVLFRQTRAGLGGRPFSLLKFRTMVSGADAMKKELQHLNVCADSRLFKIPRDPRITHVGRILRRSSLDELPQLFNVLRGNMSLVGPRPFFPDDIQHYEADQMARLTVLPGITGLWQVSGRSRVTDFEQVVRYDLEYIRTWSLVSDLKILARTLPAALRGDGAL